MNVALVGASAKPERYSYRALKLLTDHGHAVYPVNPALKEIDGLRVYSSISSITDSIHTVTLYVGPERSERMIDEIISLKPRRLIFNPGSENNHLEKAAHQAGIETLHACTLVMLSTGQF